MAGDHPSLDRPSTDSGVQEPRFPAVRPRRPLPSCSWRAGRKLVWNGRGWDRTPLLIAVFRSRGRHRGRHRPRADGHPQSATIPPHYSNDEAPQAGRICSFGAGLRVSICAFAAAGATCLKGDRRGTKPQRRQAHTTFSPPGGGLSALVSRQLALQAVLQQRANLAFRFHSQ